MLVLLTTILGALSPLLPKVVESFQDARDKAHELEIMKLQMLQAEKGMLAKSDEVGLQGYSDIVQAALADQSHQVEGSSQWVKNASALVRPVIAYTFTALYVAVKLLTVYSLLNPSLPWQEVSFLDIGSKTFTENDALILSYIIAYYFGDRTIAKRMMK